MYNIKLPAEEKVHKPCKQDLRHCEVQVLNVKFPRHITSAVYMFYSIIVHL